MYSRIDYKPNCSTSNELAVFDIAKLIFSFFVVCIHTGISVSNQNLDLCLMQGLFRIAVPFFFLSAGYFLFNKVSSERLIDNNSRNFVKKYIVRIVFMYIIWSLIYFVAIQLPDWIKDGVSLRDIFIYIEYATIRGDSYLHLWYLSSLYTGVFLLYLTQKWFKLKAVLIISFVFFVIGLLLLPYYFLIKPVVESVSVFNWLYTAFNRFIGWPRCGLFFGFIFVTLGAYLSKHKITIKPCFCIIGLVLSLVLSMFELTLINNHWSWNSGTYGALQLSHIPVVFFLFYFLIMFDNIKLKHAKEIRTISTLVYLLHPLILHFIQKTSFYQQVSDYPFGGGVTVYLASILAALVWILIEKKTFFNFLSKLR